MSIPTSLPELSSPTNLLSVKSEVLCNPQDWVGHTTELASAELLRNTAGKWSESETSLEPRVCPAESLVVVDDLARERTVVVVFLSIAFTNARVEGFLVQGDVESSQANVDSDLCLDLLLNVRRVDVAFVLGPHTHIICVPFVAKVANQYHRSYKQCDEDSECCPEALQNGKFVVRMHVKIAAKNSLTSQPRIPGMMQMKEAAIMPKATRIPTSKTSDMKGVGSGS